MSKTYECHLLENQRHILENQRHKAKQIAYERKIQEINMKTQLFAQIQSSSFMRQACLALNTNITNEEFLSLSKDILESRPVGKPPV